MSTSLIYWRRSYFMGVLLQFAVIPGLRLCAIRECTWLEAFHLVGCFVSFQVEIAVTHLNDR